MEKKQIEKHLNILNEILRIEKSLKVVENLRAKAISEPRKTLMPIKLVQWGVKEEDEICHVSRELYLQILSEQISLLTDTKESFESEYEQLTGGQND